MTSFLPSIYLLDKTCRFLLLLLSMLSVLWSVGGVAEDGTPGKRHRNITAEIILLDRGLQTGGRRHGPSADETLKEILRSTPKRMGRPLSVLFIGDSSVRNSALALLLSLCNPDGNFASCDPAILLPFLQDESGQGRTMPLLKNAFSCPSADDGGRPNRCTSVMEPVFTQLQNLTSATFYQSRSERAARWKAREVMPLLTLRHSGEDGGRSPALLLHILEAGCSSRTDGLWRMLDFLIDSTRNATVGAPSATGTSGGVGYVHTSGGRFVPFDALVLSGGLHCSYKVYRGGNWYRSLFLRIPPLVAASRGLAVVWLEVTHCLKGDGGHFYRQGSKFMLNYRKLAACPYIDQHVATMNRLVEEAGAVVAPTRHLTHRLSLMPSATREAEGGAAASLCLFVDLMHPSVECYLRIARSLALTLQFALESDVRSSDDRAKEPDGWLLRNISRRSAQTQVSRDLYRRTELVEEDPLPVYASQSFIAEAAALVVAVVAVGSRLRRGRAACGRRAG
jgi:hypothetical protein